MTSTSSSNNDSTTSLIITPNYQHELQIQKSRIRRRRRRRRKHNFGSTNKQKSLAAIWLLSIILTFGLSTKTSSANGGSASGGGTTAAGGGGGTTIAFFVCNGKQTPLPSISTQRRSSGTNTASSSSSFPSQSFAVLASSDNKGSSSTPFFFRQGRRRITKKTFLCLFQNEEEEEEEALSISSAAGEGISYTAPTTTSSSSSSSSSSTKSSLLPLVRTRRERFRQKIQNSNTALFALFKRFSTRDAGATGDDAAAAASITAASLQEEEEEEEDECIVLENPSSGRMETLCLDALHVTRGGGGGSSGNGQNGNGVSHEEEASTLLEYDEEEEDVNNEEEEEETEEKEEEEKEKHVDYNVPAVPSFELPEPIHINGDQHDEHFTKEEASLLNKEEINQEENKAEEENKEEEEESREKQDKSKASSSSSSSSVHRGIIIMDNFSPFHGQYISRMAREAYNAGVVSVLSSYVTGYLYQERGITDHLSMRLPSDDAIEEWVAAIPFEIVGIVCESDSGLDDAERLGEMLGLYPDRHDGYNLARRNKFLMNEVVKEYGLSVVEQRLCRTLEEAIDFAKELGVTDDGDDGSGGDEDEDVNEEEVNVDDDDDDGVSAESINGKKEEDTREEELLDEMEKEMEKEQMIQLESIQKENELMESIMDEQRLKNDEESLEQEHASNNGVLGTTTTSTTTPNKQEEEETYCVVKPMRGVASDDVHLCTSLTSVTKAFNKIHQSSIFGTMKGEKHESVLLQEFASGTEYAIDIVSKGGQHKVAALWRYDKRPVNGAPFVYHATELVDADTKVGRAVSEYAMEALDALNVHWGMSHTEVIASKEDGEPRLVEVNCRQHNTDFAPLTTAAVGYNALDMLLAAYLGDADDFPPHTEHMRLVWDDLPDLPVTRAYGAIVHLVSHVEGAIKEVNYEALEEIEGMESVMAMEVYQRFLSVGNDIEKTVDIRSDTGWVHIMNNDEEQFLKDYNRILELMEVMFVVEEGDDDDDDDDEGADVEMRVNGETEEDETVNGEYETSTPLELVPDGDKNAMGMNGKTAPSQVTEDSHQ